MAINVELLDRVMAQIEAHPELWNQQTWHCGTSFCFGGWAIELDNRISWNDALTETKFARQPDGFFGSWSSFDQTHGKPVWSVAEVAAMVLGLDNEEDAADLFDELNTLTDLRRIVANLKELAEVQVAVEAAMR